MLYKILTYIGSLIAIGFGTWHFFVPKLWNWYSYFDSKATELVVAVRATNVFFSLSLVLIGIMNIVLISSRHSSRHTIITVFLVNITLWLTRVVLQIVAPQGSMSVFLQYGLLSVFIIVLFLFVVALLLYMSNKN
jgi:hypothetical protein